MWTGKCSLVKAVLPFLSFHAVFSGYVFLLFFEIPFHTKKVRCRSVHVISYIITSYDAVHLVKLFYIRTFSTGLTVIWKAPISYAILQFIKLYAMFAINTSFCCTIWSKKSLFYYFHSWLFSHSISMIIDGKIFEKGFISESNFSNESTATGQKILPKVSL